MRNALIHLAQPGPEKILTMKMKILWLQNLEHTFINQNHVPNNDWRKLIQNKFNSYSVLPPFNPTKCFFSVYQFIAARLF